MRICRILNLAGPNVWSRKTMLEVRLECDDPRADPTPAMQECLVRLRNWFGNELEAAGTAARHAGFVTRIENAIDCVDLFAKLVVIFQEIAGTPVEQQFVEPAEGPGEWRVVVEYVEDAVAKLAVQFAQRLVWPENAPAPDFAECCRALRDCAREACFGTTTGPIVAAARARGIPVMRLDGDCLLQLGHGARQRRVQGVITGDTGYLAEAISRDKLLTKRLMSQLGLPTAAGRLVRDPQDAWAAACEIGLPVVVKPRDADYGNGVSVHLLTKAQVMAGWDVARQFRSDVLVERHLAGVPHRLLIVNDALVAAVRRDPAHVVGDGRQSLRELIAEANCDPRRGDGPEFPWFPILIDEKLLQVLDRQGFSLESIPPAGLLVTLQYDPKTCYAEMIRDVTECVHPDVADAARDAVRLTGLDVAGVDVMAIDITKPLAEQDGGILEVNAGPAIYLHRSPMCHPPRPVPEAVVESLIPPNQNGRIPIIAVLGGDQAAAIAAHVGALLSSTGHLVGVSSATGTRVGGRVVTAARSDHAAGCTALLLHPRVEVAVSELSVASIRESGLPFEECQVAVLAGGACGPKGSTRSLPWERCRQVLIEALSPSGSVVANVDDAELASFFIPGDGRVLAVASSRDHAFLERHSSLGGLGAFVEGGDAVVTCGDELVLREPLLGERVSASGDEFVHLVGMAISCLIPCRHDMTGQVGCGLRTTPLSANAALHQPHRFGGCRV